MRSRYWSSDVCSSDLPEPAWVGERPMIEREGEIVDRAHSADAEKGYHQLLAPGQLRSDKAEQACSRAHRQQDAGNEQQHQPVEASEQTDEGKNAAEIGRAHV